MVWSPISMGMISSDLPFIKAPSIKVSSNNETVKKE